MFELLHPLRIQRQLLVLPCDYLHTFPCDYLHKLTGNTAVYLASFTANAAPGIRMWLVDSGSSCFVEPFRDTMILPIRTELQVSVIGGTQSNMVSPLILSFLDADMKYAVLQFQGLFLLESLPIPLFATGPCEQQGWGFCLHASSSCVPLPDDSFANHRRAQSGGKQMLGTPASSRH